MLGEVLTVLNIIKAVMDIWGRVKPAQTAESAKQLIQHAEQQASRQDLAEVIRTLKGEAYQQLAPTDVDALIMDVQYRWVLEVLKTHLRQTPISWGCFFLTDYSLYYNIQFILKSEYLRS